MSNFSYETSSPKKLDGKPAKSATMRGETVQSDGPHSDPLPNESTVRRRVRHVEASQLDDYTAQSQGPAPLCCHSWARNQIRELVDGRDARRTADCFGKPPTTANLKQRSSCAAAARTSSSATASKRSRSRPVRATTHSSRRICRTARRIRAPAEPAVVVITRSMQAAVVVNLPALYPL